MRSSCSFLPCALLQLRTASEASVKLFPHLPGLRKQPKVACIWLRARLARRTLFVDGYDASGNRVYDKVSGMTCHQCRQKTLGRHTSCSQCQTLHVRAAPPYSMAFC